MQDRMDDGVYHSGYSGVSVKQCADDFCPSGCPGTGIITATYPCPPVAQQTNQICIYYKQIHYFLLYPPQ